MIGRRGAGAASTRTWFVRRRALVPTVLVVALAGTGLLTGTALAAPTPPLPVGPGQQSVTVVPDGWFTEASFVDAPDPGDVQAALAQCGNKDDPASPSCVGFPGGIPDGTTAAVTWGAPSRGGGRSGLATRPGAGGQVTLGQPFELTDWTFLNRPISGGSPTMRAYRATLRVTPPGAAPFTIVTDDPASAPGPDGRRDPMRVGIKDTPNLQTVEQCDPALQRSTVPCDDVTTLDLSGGRDPVFTQDANGTTWRLEVLGWRAADGSVTRSVTSVEATDTALPLLVVLTRVDVAGLCADPSGAARAGYTVVPGTPGDNVLRGGPGKDLLLGGGGRDVLFGGAGDDVLCGGPGTDVLQGEAGDDVLVGGPDADVLNGGPGTDRGLDSDLATVRIGVEQTS